MNILKVSNLSVRYTSMSGQLNVINQVSFAIDRGTTLGIVGESGSGKSQLAMAIMGLLESDASISGNVIFEGQSLLEMNNDRRRQMNGNRIAMVFQDPMSALNPYLSIATQMTEALIAHQHISYKQALVQSIGLLTECGIENARRRITGYPHEFSGGMRQRILIATALLCKPAILIADEPTTALDVSMQAQILDLLTQLQNRHRMTMMLISHDFGVVSALCDTVLVMYGGQVMEYGRVTEVLNRPLHPYTQGLLASMPTLKKTPGQLYNMQGDPPDPASLPAGCPFEPRCEQRIALCKTAKAEPMTIENRHVVCHLGFQ